MDGLGAEGALQAVVETVKPQDEELAAELALGNLSRTNLVRAEDLMADMLVQSGFDTDWKHNERGRLIEELIGWVVSWKADHEH